MRVKVWVVAYTSEYENGERFMNTSVFGNFDKATESIDNDYSDVLREARADHPDGEIKWDVCQGYASIEYPGHSFEWIAEEKEVDIDE